MKARESESHIRVRLSHPCAKPTLRESPCRGQLAGRGGRF